MKEAHGFYNQWEKCILEKVLEDDSREDITTKSSKHPTTKNITRIVYSTNDTSWGGNESKENRYPNDPSIFPETVNPHKCSSSEKCMSRRERIINWMRDKGLDTTDNILRSESPLGYSKIDACMDDKSEHNNSKNIKCFLFPRVFFPEGSIEPYSNKHYADPYNDRFTCYLDSACIFWINKPSGPCECRNIGLKKRFKHVLHCNLLSYFVNFLSDKYLTILYFIYNFISMKSLPKFSEHAEQVLYPERIRNRRCLKWLLGFVAGAVIGLTQVSYREVECLPDMKYPWLNQLWEALFPENICKLRSDSEEILPQWLKNLTSRNLLKTGTGLCVLDYAWKTEVICADSSLQMKNSVRITKWK